MCTGMNFTSADSIIIISRYSWICRLRNTIDRSSNGNFMPSWIAFHVSREEQKVPTCSQIWIVEKYVAL